jgi:putative ABC transport system permease protein
VRGRIVGHSLVRALARAASFCYPGSFRRGHADDFIDVAAHHFDRESAARRPAGAALAVSRVIIHDALASAPAMWMDTIAGEDRRQSAPRAIWNRISGAMHGGRHDLWLAARAAKRRPGFSVVVMLTLGIGIGASTSAFDALDRAILRPLPFYRSHELSLLVMDEVQQHYTTSVPIAALNLWRAKATTVRQVEVFRRMSAVRTTEGGSDVREAVGISGGLPGLLGIRPVAGRLITPSDAQPSAPGVVMIGEDYWRSAFGGDPATLGRTITIAGKPVQIVGVWPAGARLDFFETPDVIRVLPAGAEYSRGSWVQVLARRQPGRTVQEVEQELAALTPVDPTQANSPLHYRVKASPPGSLLLGNEFIAGVWLVFAGGLLLLGASIVNASHLLLERAAARHHELGVRLALGGSRARLFRLFLSEGVVYAIGALAAGAFIAVGLERVISTVEPRLYREAAGAGLFGRAFLFAAGTAVLAAICCSIAPLARARGRDVSRVLGQSGTRIVRGRSAFTTGLVSAQAGLAVLLVFGAVLMARSLSNLLAVDPGIELPRLAEVSVSLPAAKYPTPDDRRRYFTQARTALESLPGVTGVVTSGMPMLLASLMNGVPWLEGEAVPAPPPDANTAVINAGAGFFRTMGIRTAAGRTFDPTETNVAVVSESFARAHGGNVVGRTLYLPKSQKGDAGYQIVGVVNDVRYSGLSNDRVTWPALYVPPSAIAINDSSSYQRFIVRTDGDPRDVIAGARRAFAAIDPQVPILGPQTGPEVLAKQTAQHRFVAMLLTGLASMGFVLAVGGVYGAVALSVSRRKRDVGLRLALGASAGRLIAVFVRSGLKPVAVGAAAGAAVVWFAAPRLDVLLFRVPPHDAASTISGLGLVVLAAAFAAFVPARQITRIDPAQTLREN